MSDVEGEWSHDAVPPRSWEWTVEEDAGFHCRVDKRVQLTSSGLSYRGDCWHPNRGGPYAIGFQTVAAFLAEGELSGDLPAEIAAAIRVHLEAHRRPGPPRCWCSWPGARPS